MSWREKFQDKLVSAEAAAQRVNSGDLIRLPLGPVPVRMLRALARRRAELHGVRVLQGASSYAHPWITAEPGWEEHIEYLTDFVSPTVRPPMSVRRWDFAVTDYAIAEKVRTCGRHDGWSADVFITPVTAPDARGFVSFGFSLWHSRGLLRDARLRIAEVSPSLLPTRGDNFAHLSDFDLVVEDRAAIALAPRYPQLSAERIEVTEVIGAYLSTLVNDRDTLQVGTGTLSSCMGSYLTEKRDLGIDAEILVASTIELVKSGVASGRYKTSHRGVATASHIVPGADFESCRDNPLIQLYDIEYVNHLPRIAGIRNLVAINQALAIDLTGQIASESIGPTMYTGPGGQLMWTMGALFAPGGRAVHVLPSTARNGKLSRIVAHFEPGTIVTVPRTFADFVITEYGIANLQGLTQRQRALALIDLAHPDFRAALREQAQCLFWP